MLIILYVLCVCKPCLYLILTKINKHIIIYIVLVCLYGSDKKQNQGFVIMPANVVVKKEGLQISTKLIIIVAVVAIAAVAIAVLVNGTQNTTVAEQETSTIQQAPQNGVQNDTEKKNDLSDDSISKRYRERMTKYNTKPK